METAKKTVKYKQMMVAFLLGGNKYFDSLWIKLSNEFMVGQEDKHPRSVMDAYNLMLH